ncbi:acyltransferase [Paraphaeosphaeria sporulosa]
MTVSRRGLGWGATRPSADHDDLFNAMYKSKYMAARLGNNVVQFNLGYGSNDGDYDHWLIQLPIIRLIVNGQVQVATFYVLSGVSLSLKRLRLARSHDFDKLFDTMFSSVFRRALRVYLPVFAVQIGVLFATLLGLYNHGYALSQDWLYGGTNEFMQTVFD